MAVNVAKPSTAGAGVIITSSTTTIGTAGTLFLIKTKSLNIEFSSPTDDVTGDGDLAPRRENNVLLSGRWSLNGFMIADGTPLGLGILSLKNQSTRAKMGVNFSSGEVLASDTPIIVEFIRINHRYDNQFVGLSMSGWFTDSDPSAEIQ